MARVIWTPEAPHYLDLIAGYLSQFDRAAARAIPAHLIKAGNSLEAVPRRGRKTAGGWHEISVRPYVISYDIDGGSVLALAIRHIAQDTPS